jgi:rhodanese-related sulfurtransferase
LKLESEQFKHRYSFSKFQERDNIIFYSNTGTRSEIVTKAALELGYKNARLNGEVPFLIILGVCLGVQDYGTSSKIRRESQ